MARAPIKTYPPMLLPQGFEYPASFFEHASQAGANDLYPWYFFDVDSDAGYTLRRLARDQDLVPFATLELGDGDVACFDLSQDALIKIMILDGSGRSYGFESFDAWLAAAKEEARNWDFSPSERDAMFD